MQSTHLILNHSNFAAVLLRQDVVHQRRLSRAKKASYDLCTEHKLTEKLCKVCPTPSNAL